jgi:hypothetical protein
MNGQSPLFLDFDILLFRFEKKIPDLPRSAGLVNKDSLFRISTFAKATHGVAQATR